MGEMQEVSEIVECDLGTIVLIAVDTKFFEILDSHLKFQYTIIPLDNFDSIDILDPSWNIKLFIINTDRPWIGLELILEKLKHSEYYQNIPAIGLSLKQHFKQIENRIRHQFEDILLMPCGAEDLLTRVDIWVKTYELVCQDNPKSQSFQIDLP
ncbi:MAG: hypothetical protein ACTSVZ_13305 [Promethearchaeota archaeon]